MVLGFGEFLTGSRQFGGDILIFRGICGGYFLVVQLLTNLGCFIMSSVRLSSRKKRWLRPEQIRRETYLTKHF